MDFRQLATFLAVAEGLSFQGAARELGYAQSTVSAQIQGLEKSLGVELFVRRGKRIELGRAGERLVPHARRLLALGERAAAEVAGGDGQVQVLDVLVPETVLLVAGEELAGRFAEACGAELQLSPGTARQAGQAVAEGFSDAALVLGECVAVDGVAAEPLGRVRLAVGGGEGLSLLDQPLQARVEAILLTPEGAGGGELVRAFAEAVRAVLGV